MNDDRVYLVLTYTDNTDPDDEPVIEYLGVAMSENRAKEIADAYQPDEGWTQKDQYYWTWEPETKWGHSAYTMIVYEPLRVL